MSSDELSDEVTGALGYLLKHAHLRLDALMTSALAPLGISPKDLGVLRVLASRDTTSQQDIAQLLNVDRTTMVALVDALEAKGAVVRTQAAEDRRRNVVALTTSGSALLSDAEAAAERADQELLKPLAARKVEQFRGALRQIVTSK